MAKSKSTFLCQNCGAAAAKWVGKCPSCLQWNTFVEEVVSKSAAATSSSSKSRKATPIAITDISHSETFRIDTKDEELNRVLGGGLVPGSVVLIGGEPGIGKSTLLLQLAMQLIDVPVLYVSGEESEQQIKLRAERLGLGNTKCYVLTETSVQQIIKEATKFKPAVLIIDSIQTMHSAFVESSPGSVSQVRECTHELMNFVKSINLPVFLVGHITKDGNIAGPKVMEHMVDTVMQFEGNRNHSYRILRTTKNRFGSTSELGIYEMQAKGLVPVDDPTDVLISQREEQLSGITIGASMEGMRPMLIEVQGLVTTAFYGTPQRATTGFDNRRLNMLLAVMEKRLGFPIGSKDVFLNLAGGFKADDPALDLAVIAALISSIEDHIIPVKTVFCAEVGLSGEVRPVQRIEQRIKEAEELGFERMFISKHNAKNELPVKSDKLQILTLSKVPDLMHFF